MEQEWNIKIYEAERIVEVHTEPIGKIMATKKEIKIAIAGGFLKVLVLQFPGKNKMSAQQLLNGISFSDEAIAC